MISWNLQKASKPNVNFAAIYCSLHYQFSADVIACNINPKESKVELLDTYNVDAPKFHNDVDKVQQSYLFSAKNEDGRISCT